MRKKKNAFDELPDYEADNEYYDDAYEAYEDEYEDEYEAYDDGYGYDWEEEVKPRKASRGRHVKPKAKPSRKKRVGRGILIGVLAVVLVIVLAVVFLFNHMYGMMNTKDKEPEQTQTVTTPVPATPEATTTPTPTETPEPTATPVPLTEEELLMMELETEAAELIYDENVYNILLVGTDDREEEKSGRSDAMFILSINKETKKIWITSLQRDIWIDIPGYGSAKLNAANVYGGLDLLTETIEQGFGVKIDNYVTVNFEDFISIADMLGGITVTMTADEIYHMNLAIVEVNCHFFDPENSNDGIIWDLVDGTYHLNGKQTLGYCRIRALDGTTARSARQRDALMQMWGNVKEMSLVDMYKIMEKAMSFISTDMSRGQCASLLLMLPSLIEYDVESHQIPVEGAFFRTNINGQACYRLDYNVNRAYLQSTVYGRELPENDLVSYITGNYAYVYYPG